MGIVDEDIARVRDATDIVAVISQYTPLRRVGQRFSGLCPFHTEKTPSFSVNAVEGLYYCFGCGVRGDAITFLRDKEQLDFVGAVETLANKANIALRYTDPGGGEERKRRTRLQEAVAEAARWYHERLLSDPDAGPARGYLRGRGFDADTVRRFLVGWAPDDWDRLARTLRLSPEDLDDAGLGFVNRRGRVQDSFRSRIMFPVYDAQGNAVGFGARNLPGAEGPKYKNSQENAIYAKSRILYGLNWAKTEIVEVDEVVVCEGYTDVIGFAQAGIGRAVATCGTALTEDHVRLLRRFARRVVLAFDADTAGQNAAARFYEWEQTHDLDVAVADLPDGVDPGDLAQSDPERLVKSVEAARPFLEFRVERALRAGSLDSVEARTRTADAALAMIVEHPNPLVRDEYAVTVASRCRLEVQRVRARLDALGRTGRSQASGPGTGAGRARTVVEVRDGPEVEALKLAIQGGDPARELSELLVPELFDNELCATVYRLVTTEPDLHSVIEQGGDQVGELVQRLSVQDTQVKPLEVAALLWAPFLERQLSEAAASVDRLDPELMQAHTWLRLRLQEVRDPAQQAGAIADLLAWIDEPAEDGR